MYLARVCRKFLRLRKALFGLFFAGGTSAAAWRGMSAGGGSCARAPRAIRILPFDYGTVRYKSVRMIARPPFPVAAVTRGDAWKQYNYIIYFELTYIIPLPHPRSPTHISLSGAHCKALPEKKSPPFHSLHSVLPHGAQSIPIRRLKVPSSHPISASQIFCRNPTTVHYSYTTPNRAKMSQTERHSRIVTYLLFFSSFPPKLNPPTQ